MIFTSSALSLPSCDCFVLTCVHNGVAPSSCSALPGTRRPSSNLPRRKGPICRHRAQIRPSAAVLVRQTEPSRGSARLQHQVSVQSVHCTRSDHPECFAPAHHSSVSVSAGMPSLCGILMRMSAPERKKST